MHVFSDVICDFSYSLGKKPELLLKNGYSFSKNMITDHTKLCMEKICRPFPVHHLDMPPILNLNKLLRE